MTEGNFASLEGGFLIYKRGCNDSGKNEEFQLLSSTEVVGLLLTSGAWLNLLHVMSVHHSRHPLAFCSRHHSEEGVILKTDQTKTTPVR